MPTAQLRTNLLQDMDMRIHPRVARNSAMPGRPGKERGATTLIVVVILLVILSIIVLLSTNVAFFEQRTTTSENRARIGEQAAEYSLNVTGEWLKSQLGSIVSSKADGWLSTDASVRRWAACADAVTEIDKDYVHPCEALEGGGILGTSASDPPYTNLYFYARGGDATGNADITSDDFDSIYNIYEDPLLADDPVLQDLLGEANATWEVEPRVQAVLCRIDSEIQGSPRCKLTPNVGNNVAVTLVSGPRIEGEATEAVIMETWATYGDFNPASAVPLVASGTVKGLGNAQVVGAPNAGGFGLAATMWSPCAIEISGNEPQPSGCDEPNASGIGSVSTCHLEGFLGDIPLDMMMSPQGCAGTNNCNCPGAGDRNFLSGHAGSVKRETFDVLDRDGGVGSPDITFFPGMGLDDPNDPSDDNLFEWIFGVDYASKSADGSSLENDGNGDTSMDCGEDGDQDCAVYALETDLGAQLVTCTELNTIADADPTAMTGIYYVTDGACSLPDQLGGPDSPVVVVVDEEASINGGLIFGMLFVRSPSNDAEFNGTGNPQVFGSVVVEGSVDMKGTVDLIYVDWAARGGNPEIPPPARNFGRVSGSWLDASRGL